MCRREAGFCPASSAVISVGCSPRRMSMSPGRPAWRSRARGKRASRAGRGCIVALSSEPLRRGYDVDRNAIRFSNYLHVFRELVHLSCGWLPLVPGFEVKYRLGDHLHDDARAVSRIRRRLYELRHPSGYPGSPGEELGTLLDRMSDAASPEEYLAIAYGEAKPALGAAMRIHLEGLDPVSDEPSQRLLSKLVERQERHVGGMGQAAGGAPPPAGPGAHRGPRGGGN